MDRRTIEMNSKVNPMTKEQAKKSAKALFPEEI
jgi:hypothetical protein